MLFLRFPIFNVGDKMSLAGENFSMQANLSKKSNKYLHIAMKTFYDPSGRSSSPKNDLGLRIEASMSTHPR
jgi:hypothetical protein